MYIRVCLTYIIYIYNILYAYIGGMSRMLKPLILVVTRAFTVVVNKRMMMRLPG